MADQGWKRTTTCGKHCLVSTYSSRIVLIRRLLFCSVFPSLARWNRGWKEPILITAGKQIYDELSLVIDLLR
jgi:hypothetical protein